MDIQKIYLERFLLEKEYMGNDKVVNTISPMVSVCVITYQHVNFIRDCIEGILMQKTDFPFEVIIGEDESIDGTREICIEYAKKYPDKIRLYLRSRETSQLYDENGKYICRFNGKWTRESARGKYIALCEGDDYWTDSLKLQKQVDFLEENPEYGLIHGDCNFLYEKDKKTLFSANKFLGLGFDYNEDTEKLFDVLIDASYKIRTATVMFRKKIYDDIKDDLALISGKFLMGDTPLWLLLSRRGKFHYFQDVFATYRISNNTASRPNSTKRKIRFVLSGLEMRIYFLKKFKKPIPLEIAQKYNKSLLEYKCYNPFFTEMYSLINPMKREVFFLKNIHISPIRLLLISYFTFTSYKRIFLSKIN